MNKVKKIYSWIRAKRSRIIIFLLIVLASMVFFWTKNNQKEKPSYQTAVAERGNIVSTVSASGNILVSNVLPITTNATGIVSKVYVKDGQTVVSGQKIAEITLDSSGAQKNASAYATYNSTLNAVSSAKNNLRGAQASLDKIYDDIQGHDQDETFQIRDIRTKAEVAKDNAYLGVVNAQAALNAAYLSYQSSSPIIYAPASGKIENIAIVVGMNLTDSSSTTQTSSSQGERIAVIKTEGKPIAIFNISEIDVSKIIQGQKATVTLDALSGKTFTGKVATVDKLGTSSSGVVNYPVTVIFDTEASEILPNMAATANIIIETKNDVLLVPSSSVTTTNGQSTVRVLKENVEQTVAVETGLTGNSQVEIISGLSEGDIVITGTSNTTLGGTQQNRSVFSPGGFGGGTQVRMIR